MHIINHYIRLFLQSTSSMWIYHSTIRRRTEANERRFPLSLRWLGITNSHLQIHADVTKARKIHLAGMCVFQQILLVVCWCVAKDISNLSLTASLRHGWLSSVWLCAPWKPPFHSHPLPFYHFTLSIGFKAAQSCKHKLLQCQCQICERQTLQQQQHGELCALTNYVRVWWVWMMQLGVCAT